MDDDALPSHDPTRLGPLLKRARESAGLTLAQVAARVGCAKSYLSAIENERRTTPSDEVLARLEQALALPEHSLASVGRWQRSLRAGGESVQRDVEQLQSQRRAGQRLAALLAVRKRHAERTGRSPLDEAYLSGELSRLVAQLAPEHAGPAGADGDTTQAPRARRPAGEPGVPMEVPLINRVAAGYPTEFTDLAYPARVADEYVRCPDLTDPDAFAARVVGDSMEPDYREGDVVVFSPARGLASGQDCFARIEPDHTTTFKRVYFETSPQGEQSIRLQPLNAKYPPTVLPRERVAGLYAAVTVIRKIP
jgi:phage repressor protein C with HTH and peptisase S24 domain/DNA-binding XRE family transcriptional regulator